MTNGDRIRQMSNEELARLLGCDACVYMENAICQEDFTEGIKTYLESDEEQMRIDTVKDFANTLDELVYDVNNLSQTVNDVKDTLTDIAERLQELGYCELTELEGINND